MNTSVKTIHLVRERVLRAVLPLARFQQRHQRRLIVSMGRCNFGAVDQANHTCDSLAAIEAKLLMVERPMRAAQGYNSIVSFDLQVAGSRHTSILEKNAHTTLELYIGVTVTCIGPARQRVAHWFSQ
jgi:hypothetical protein